MNRLLSTCCCAFIIMLISGCSNVDLKLDFRYIEGIVWVDSYEESITNDYTIFRPSDFMEFPPSRCRRSFFLMESNECNIGGINCCSPNPDGASKGQWQYDKNQNILSMINFYFEVTYEYEVLNILANKLVLKRIEN